jgi:methyltransferase (TIGR00027 family)
VIEGLPSLTALGVLGLRALSSLPGSPADHVGDRGLRMLVPGPIDRGLDVLGAVTARAPIVHGALRTLTVGLADHLALRTDAIDAELRRALGEGIPQVVLLGAGLDARGFRLEAMRAASLFEVDVASTQAVKRAWARSHRSLARAHHFVEVDFARDALDVRLRAAGFDPARPSVWLWEGVTMYLPPLATEATLRTIAALSPAGSRALVTYVTGEMVNAPLLALPAILAAFDVLGEPLIGRLEPDELAALATREGFAVTRDSGSRDWARAHYRARPSRWEITERLAVLAK